MFELTDVTLNGLFLPRLHNVTLTVDSDRTAVVGYSGAGKTSLLNVFAGFEAPDRGKVRVSIRSRQPPRLPLYWVPQNGGLWPHLTVNQHLTVVSKVPEFSDEILNTLDLVHCRSSFPTELSQGERSRLSLARALATRAQVLLMDEPLSHVDPIRKPTYWNMVGEMLAREKIAVIFSSHEPETVLRQSDQVICLHEGRVIFHGPTRELYETPSSQLLGEFLGPLNWFDTGEVAQFLEAREGLAAGPGIRPERLLAEGDKSSSLELVRVVFRGTTVESVVKHLESGKMRIVKHQVIGEMPHAGQRIRLRLV